MSASEELLNDQDPDYVSTTSNDQAHQKIYEENARNATIKKITTIIEKEFSQEIDLKEKEILQIQERLHKTLKIFHLLRYIIITNFYNHKHCQIPQVVEITKQTRIHPAIKTLLGKSPRSVNYTDFAVPSTSIDPRFLYDDKSFASGASTVASNTFKTEENANKRSNMLQNEKRKVLNKEFQSRKIPRYMPPKSSMSEKIYPSRGNSHKIRKRIVVGNISKWIPPDWREDASSHKWTMYVRGDKDENAIISTFVSKVRFFLHPSYRPNDVVEVTSYPFHLTRRGWGEFPLRVQLHFKNSLNKPMDIIHHLKLDRTYTGLQTLGSETLVDVWIHMVESHNPEQNSNKFVESSINDNSVKIQLNNGDSSESTYKQSAKFITDTSQFNTCEETQAKKEIPDLEVHERFNSLNLMSIKNSESLKIKSESNDAITHISSDKHREAICHYIKHDHNYFCRQYFNSHHYTVREGNMTVEHFPENNCMTSVTNLSTVENNKKESDIAVMRRTNNNIQSFDNYQPLTSSSLTQINDLQMVSVNATIQENNSQKNLLFDTDKSLQAKNPKSNTFRILEIPSVKDTLMINGFCKPFDTSRDCFNKQKTVSSSETCNSHLKPLQISIPPSNIFASSCTNKHILVLKDKKSVSVDLTSILPSKCSKNLRLPIDDDMNITKLNVRIPQGVSILKKPSNIKANTPQKDTINNNKKKIAVLKLKDVNNSLLLNVNENVPILKIADSHDLQYNYNLIEATRDAPSIDKQKLLSCARLEEKTVMQRSKITLGKDKFKIQSKKDLYEAILRSIDTANITDTEALIRFIIRRLPIVTQDVRDPDYRRLHPYACCSEEEYLTYNIGKQRAMEWYRAKTIRNFIQMKLISIDQLWSIKEIILWARLHGYTPSKITFKVQETVGTSDTKKLPYTITSTTISSTCTEPIALQKWLQLYQQEPNHQSTDNYINYEEIDVENIKECSRRITIDRRKSSSNQDSNYSTASTLIPIEFDEDLLPFHNFVCSTARDIGIEIGSEEIIPGILYCAASRIMMRVVECFVEDLTRSSLARAWERNDRNECPKVISLNDVRNALTNREEFAIFTNEGLGSRQELNTTEL